MFFVLFLNLREAKGPRAVFWRKREGRGTQFVPICLDPHRAWGSQFQLGLKGIFSHPGMPVVELDRILNTLQINISTQRTFKIISPVNKKWGGPFLSLEEYFHIQLNCYPKVYSPFQLWPPHSTSGCRPSSHVQWKDSRLRNSIPISLPAPSSLWPSPLWDSVPILRRSLDTSHFGSYAKHQHQASGNEWAGAGLLGGHFKLIFSF